MPEGPSIVILREAAAPFVGQVIAHASGNSKTVDITALQGAPVLALRSWGKHFLIQLPDRSLRIHFMLFGSYRINDPKDVAPRLRLQFKHGEIDFYACSVREIGQDLDAIYDWRTDVMSDAWDPKLARKRLHQQPHMLVCDALLDQAIFAGVGNIIKNEVLFRIRLHPLSQVGALSPRKLGELVDQARTYSFDFLAWKRDFVLRAHWLAHTKSTCPRCHIPFHKGKLGRSQRRSFFCERCQKRYLMDT
jgi:endonuclease-8